MTEADEVGGEEAMSDPGLGEEHRDAAAVADEAGRELRADEPASDHDDVRAFARDLAQVVVVGEVAEPDDSVGARESPAGVAPVASRSFSHEYSSPASSVAVCAAEIERDDAPSGDELGALGRLAPELLLGSALPEALREQRPLVRRVGIGADERDRAVGVVLPDALRSHVAGHAGADDEVLGRVHL